MSSDIVVVLIFSSSLDAIYSSSSLIVEARTPIFYDVEMKRVEILVLFLILEERLSVFHCWVCTYEVVSWQHGPSILTMMKIFSWTNDEVYQVFFCVCWDHVLFPLVFISVVYHINWFTNIKMSLHPCNKPLDHGVWSF